VGGVAAVGIPFPIDPSSLCCGPERTARTCGDVGAGVPTALASFDHPDDIASTERAARPLEIALDLSRVALVRLPEARADGEGPS
jgi:hypothetical protein